MSNSEQSDPQAGAMAEQGQEIVIRANYEIFVFFLTVLQAVNSVLIFLLKEAGTRNIPLSIIGGVSLFLIGDALYRIWKTSDRRLFLFGFHGYLLLLGSLPIPFAAFLRLTWYWLLAAKLRRTDYVNMQNVVIHRRAQSAMLGVMSAALVMLEVSSILIIHAETSATDSNIKTAGDAVWWSLVTMATVGYGDKYPVTTSGRVIAVFMMFIGVGIFTVLTSFLTEAFTHPRRARDELRRVNDKMLPHDVSASLSDLRYLIDKYDQEHLSSMQEIQTKLDELEQRLVLTPRHASEQKGLPEDAPDSDSP